MMTAASAHPDDPHYVHRTGWLRASVLGANDGIISVSSLIIGVAAATPEPGAIMVAGVAALMAGAMSMAAGEYISVSSQADSEQADIRREAEATKDGKCLRYWLADQRRHGAGIIKRRGWRHRHDAESELRSGARLEAEALLEAGINRGYVSAALANRAGKACGAGASIDTSEKD